MRDRAAASGQKTTPQAARPSKPVGAARSGPVARLDDQAIVSWQRAVGNRSVSSLVAAGRLPVQRDKGGSAPGFRPVLGEDAEKEFQQKVATYVKAGKSKDE